VGDFHTSIAASAAAKTGVLHKRAMQSARIVRMVIGVLLKLKNDAASPCRQF
jgi:hypothetical protein